MSQSESSLDAIKPAPSRGLSAIHHRSNELDLTHSDTQSAGGYLESKEFYRYAEQLNRIVRKRGENAESWIRALKSYVDEHQTDNVDWKKTFANITTAGDRITKGEYLVTYRGEYREEFAPRKIVTLFNSILEPLAKSLRPSERVLPYFMSSFASKQSQGEPLSSGEYRGALEIIANHYSFYQSGGFGDMVSKGHSVKRSEEAETWCKEVYSLYKESRNVLRRAADSSRLNADCKKLRWNLMVTATYVCSGQLPTAQRVVHGDYDGVLSSPPNVKSPGEGFVRAAASHSLARISRRYARLVGYNGPEAQQGGLELI